MPLLDHFHPPLSRTHPWRGFHGAWAAAMARLLNAGGLPPGYYAVPFFDRDGPMEIDVAAREGPESSTTNGPSTVPQPWMPAEPDLTVAVEWSGIDDIQVEVFTDDGDPRLAAAVEFVSPRNKDRPRAREAFASKCAELLRRGCGVVVVDVVTTRRADLHADLLTALGAELSSPVGGSLSAIAYRSLGRDENGQLQAWPTSLEVGRSLPTVPLWLAGDVVVQLDLDASYTAACADLMIRQAG